MLVEELCCFQVKDIIAATTPGNIKLFGEVLDVVFEVDRDEATLEVYYMILWVLEKECSGDIEFKKSLHKGVEGFNKATDAQITEMKEILQKYKRQLSLKDGRQ